MSAEIEHQVRSQRFVLTTEGQEAELTYKRSGDTLLLVHTAVPSSLQHRGLANQLAEAVLAYAREQGLRVDPQCRFMAVYLKRHPEQQDLLIRPL